MVGSERLPDLKTGATLFIFQSFGRVPSRMDWVKIICKIWLEMTSVAFSIFTGMLSGPGELEILSFFIRFMIPSAVTSMAGMSVKSNLGKAGMLVEGSHVKTEEK